MVLQVASVSEHEGLLISQSPIINISAVFFLSILASFSVAYFTFSRRSSSHYLYIVGELQIVNALTFELEALLLKEEKSRKELSTKTRELTMLILYLILKNQTFDSIHKELGKFAKLPDENIPTNLSKVIAKAALSMMVEKNWELFNTNLQKLNFDFLDQLAARYPNLTPGDLKLCSLIKNKNHPKEIANLMEISRDSAKIAKHRLKRKLGLKKEENLDEFLGAFNINSPIPTPSVAPSNDLTILQN